MKIKTGKEWNINGQVIKIYNMLNDDGKKMGVKLSVNGIDIAAIGKSKDGENLVIITQEYRKPTGKPTNDKRH